MPDQEFLASYAVDIDEQGVERLQSILDENRSLAESLSKAFQQAYADLDSFVREAIGAIPSLARFEEAQRKAAGEAERAGEAMELLAAAYKGLASAIPDVQADFSLRDLTAGIPDAAMLQAPRGTVPLVHLKDAPNEPSLRYSEPERNETNRKAGETLGYLAEISGAVGRLVNLTAGDDRGSDAGGGDSGAGAGVMGESSLSLNLAGASEELQGFLEGMASSEAEIPAGLNLAGADEDLAALQARAGETEAAMPLRLDRTRAEASLADLRRILMDPVRLSADTAGILSAASSALTSIKNSFAGTTLSLKAAVTVSGDDGAGDGGDAGSDAGVQGTSSGSDSPLANALRAAAGGRYTRPTKVEVAEDGDTEYIIPVDKEADAVPLLRQALADLSASARENVLGSVARENVSRLDAGTDLGTLLAATPDVKAPTITLQEVPAPEIQLPDTSVPESRMPELSVPEIQIPEMKSPDITLPDISIPEIVAPEVSVPDISIPELNVPEVSVPEIHLPDMKAPEITIPDIAVPDVNVPDVSVPEIKAPDISIPEISVPDLDLPGFESPDIDLSALDALAGLPEMMAAAVAVSSVPANVSNVENKSVEAPVHINVTASGADPQILGRSIYDSAQRYLQKTLRSALT